MRPASIVFHRNRSPRQPLPLGQWAEPGQTLAAQWAALEAEHRLLNPEESAVDKLPRPVRVLLIAIGAVASWGLLCAIAAVLP